MGVKPLFANILWISLIYGIYSTSISGMRYAVFDEE